jgi:hypothetical protein
MPCFRTATQAAVNAAPPNGNVLLHPGTYSGEGNVGVVGSKPLAIIGSTWDPADVLWTNEHIDRNGTVSLSCIRLSNCVL